MDCKPATNRAGLTLRQAGLTAGIGYLIGPTPYAEYVFSKLLIPGSIEQTAQNTIAHPGLLQAAIVCYVVNFIGDIVTAWALFYLVAPVSRPVSLLTSWFRIIFAAVGLAATLNLVIVTRIILTPAYLTAFGPAALHALVDLLMHSFRYGFAFSLILFGVHLGLLGYLIVRSKYIPWVVGMFVIVAGLGYVLDGISDYLFPGIHLGWVSFMFYGELAFTCGYGSGAGVYGSRRRISNRLHNKRMKASIAACRIVCNLRFVSDPLG